MSGFVWRKAKIWLAMSWLILTFALVIWWWIFADRLLSQIAGTDERSLRGYHMLLYEGGTLLGLVIVGGVSLLLFIYRDAIRAERLRLFFANFSHDIKTAIARLRLQSDLLAEDKAFHGSAALQRLVQDIARLDLQLENSLMFAGPKTPAVAPQRLRLSELIASLRTEFPELELHLRGDLEFSTDKRILLLVLRNILQNSTQHGQAQKVSISTLKTNQQIEMNFIDDGKGSKVLPKELGHAPLSSAGSGVGLYLLKTLLTSQRGRIEFSNEVPGFKVRIILPNLEAST